MRSLHDVADSFFVGDDAHIVPRAGYMSVPALHTQIMYCHCERLYGARQSVLLLVHLCAAGVTDRRAAPLLAMTPLFTDI